MFSAEEILDMAIKIEENGEEFYLKLAEKADEVPESQEVANLARKFAKDEREHRKRFLELKQRILHNKEPDIIKKVSGLWVQDAIGDNLFSLTTVDIEDIKSIEDIINIAVRLEKESIEFYEILKPLADETGKKIIDQIIEEERVHKSVLASF